MKENHVQCKGKVNTNFYEIFTVEGGDVVTEVIQLSFSFGV